MFPSTRISSNHLILPLVFPGGKRKAAYGWSCWKTLDQTLFPVPKVGTKQSETDLRLFPFLGNELIYPNQTESLENHHIQQKYLWDVQSNFEDC